MSGLKHLIKKIPGTMLLAQFVHLAISLVKYKSARTLLFSPPGHFYSPLPDLGLIRQASLTDRPVPDTLPGIETRDDDQLALLREFSRYHDEVPFPEAHNGTSRYYYDNRYFGTGDAIALYCMMRKFRPRRIVEVGSGFSSAAMLDTNDALNGQAIDFTFIEPHPERLQGLLSERDQRSCTLIEATVQTLPADTFSELTGNDILFIDSSHVSKFGSDVHFLLFEVLPALRPGVIIHFHDILWPFEYPKDWLLQGISWNEAYLLRAFLTSNPEYEVLFFNSYIGHRHAGELKACLPKATDNIGGSLWLRKRGSDTSGTAGS